MSNASLSRTDRSPPDTRDLTNTLSRERYSVVMMMAKTGSTKKGSVMSTGSAVRWETDLLFGLEAMELVQVKFV